MVRRDVQQLFETRGLRLEHLLDAAGVAPLETRGHIRERVERRYADAGD